MLITDLRAKRGEWALFRMMNSATCFRPCTLLGAVHIEMGDIVIGAEWYEKAEARGANREMIDRELASILRAAPQDQGVQFKTALKGYDASRYNWL